MNTVRFGVQGALIGWNARDFVPSDAFGWDTYSARADRYQSYADYYNNTQHDGSINPYTAVMMHAKKMYKHTRGARTPVARSVDFFVGKVYIGSLDMETAETGAVPLQADRRIRDAVIHYWDASNWNTLKNIYVRNGAIKGDTFIKNVNDPIQGSIYGEILDPMHVTDYKLDNQGLITYAVIEYQMTENVNNSVRSWMYKEVIESDMQGETHFATYKNNQPFAYYKDENGKDIAEWDTDYGFVPISLAQHTNMGLQSGAACFHTALGKIDEINAQASLLNDQINKAVNVTWFMTGVGKGNGTDGSNEPEITLNNDSKTNVSMIKAGKDARATALIADINIEAALKVIESLEKSVEYELPENALHWLWEAQQPPSGVAMDKLYDPVISRVELARVNYDSATVNAQSQAIAMGAYHGYAEYRAFNVRDYWNGNLKHHIKDRPVFSDALGKQATITALGTVKDQPSKIAALMLNKMDYDEKTIKDVVAQLDEQQAAADEAAARAFMQSALGGDDNGDAETAETNTANQPAPTSRVRQTGNEQPTR